jgi:hypothetical protein
LVLALGANERRTDNVAGGTVTRYTCSCF